MQLTLTPEQTQLSDGVDRFVAERLPESLRHSRAASPDGLDRAIWREMAELGWLAAGLAEDEGGWGGSPVETMVIMERAGHGMVSGPLVDFAVHSMRLLLACGVDATLIGGIASGDKVIAVANIDASPQNRATLEVRESGLVLSGVKHLVPAGDAADAFIVTASLDGQRALVLVEANQRGVSAAGYRTLDDRRAADVTFDKVAISGEALLATGAKAQSALEQAERHAVAALCAEATGIAQYLLEATLEYAKTRQQFGQPIGRFQALQHRFADMFVAIEEARSLTMRATASMCRDDDPAGSAHAVAAAKFGVVERTMHVGREAIQLHGGVGMTEDLPIGAGFRRLKVISLMQGGQNDALDRMAPGIASGIYV